MYAKERSKQGIINIIYINTDQVRVFDRLKIAITLDRLVSNI